MIQNLFFFLWFLVVYMHQLDRWKSASKCDLAASLWLAFAFLLQKCNGDLEICSFSSELTWFLLYSNILIFFSPLENHLFMLFIYLQPFFSMISPIQNKFLVSFFSQAALAVSQNCWPSWHWTQDKYWAKMQNTTETLAHLFPYHLHFLMFCTVTPHPSPTEHLVNELHILSVEQERNIMGNCTH